MTQASGSPGKCGAKTAHQWSSVNLKHKNTRRRYQFCIHYTSCCNLCGTGAQSTIYIHVVMPNMVHIASYRNCGNKKQLRMSRCSPMAFAKCMVMKTMWKKHGKNKLLSLLLRFPGTRISTRKQKGQRASSFSFAANVLIWSAGKNIWPNHPLPPPLQGYKYLHQEWGFMVYGNNSMIQLKTWSSYPISQTIQYPGLKLKPVSFCSLARCSSWGRALGIEKTVKGVAKPPTKAILEEFLSQQLKFIHKDIETHGKYARKNNPGMCQYLSVRG